MHYLYLVSLPKGEADTVERAMDIATSFLDSNGFAGEGGLYSSAKADRYEVGGRWTGKFTRLMPWYKEFAEQFQKLMDTKYSKLTSGVRGVWYGKDSLEEIAKVKAIKDINKLWAKMPQSKDVPQCPETRNTEIGFRKSTFPDDAVVMTAELWSALKEFSRPGNDSMFDPVQVVFTDTCEEYEVHDLETYYKVDEIVGRWFVIIDYHN